MERIDDGANRETNFRTDYCSNQSALREQRLDDRAEQGFEGVGRGPFGDPMFEVLNIMINWFCH